MKDYVMNIKNSQLVLIENGTFESLHNKLKDRSPLARSAAIATFGFNHFSLEKRLRHVRAWKKVECTLTFSSSARSLRQIAPMELLHFSLTNSVVKQNVNQLKST